VLTGVLLFLQRSHRQLPAHSKESFRQHKHLRILRLKPAPAMPPTVVKPER
jgi:hypothetical protein